jgi:hypothetical protein
MQYSLSTTILFALALGITNVHSSPLTARDVGQTDEIDTNIQDWYKNVLKINAFIENVGNLSSSDLALKGAAIVEAFADYHTWEAQLNSDIPGFDAADQEFNYAFNSVWTAFQNLRNSGKNGQSANQSDITECAMRSCG